MADPLKNVEKKLDEILKGVRRVDDALAQPSPGSYESLAAADVEELRLLVAHREDLAEFSSRRISEQPTASGSYDELRRLGLVTRSAGGAVVLLSRPAEWVVARHDERVAAQKGLLFLEHVWAIATALVGVVVGWLLAKI